VARCGAGPAAAAALQIAAPARGGLQASSHPPGSHLGQLAHQVRLLRLDLCRRLLRARGCKMLLCSKKRRKAQHGRFSKLVKPAVVQGEAEWQSEAELMQLRRATHSRPALWKPQPAWGRRGLAYSSKQCTTQACALALILSMRHSTSLPGGISSSHCCSGSPLQQQQAAGREAAGGGGRSCSGGRQCLGGSADHRFRGRQGSP